MNLTTPESILWDDWHVVAEVQTVRRVESFSTMLFDRRLVVRVVDEAAHVAYASHAQRLPAVIKYGYVWTCLGQPNRDIVHFRESEEADRYVAPAGSLGLHCSGLRAVENFLDLAHLPFVHAHYLGDEQHTEVFPYNVEVSKADELWVTGCRFFQPQASPTAETGLDIDYTYRVTRPYTAVLYKTNPLQAERCDMVALMAQPVSEEQCVLHLLNLYLKLGDPDEEARWFTQLIVSQDKRILENQRPRRLPLDPRAELPVRADLVGTKYRAWLRDHDVRYGAVLNVKVGTYA